MTDSKLSSHKATNNNALDNKNGNYSTGLEKVIAAVVAAAHARPGDRIVDLGCGAGQLSLRLAERGARVLAVDGNQVALRQAGGDRTGTLADRRSRAWPGRSSACRCRPGART